MTAMADTAGGVVRLPRSIGSKDKLSREQRLELAARYLRSDDKARDTLVKKWGRGRVRRSLLEFARHEHELEFQALRLREEV